MSTQQVRVMVPPQVRAPRGADWAVRTVVWLFRIGGTRRQPRKANAVALPGSAA